jgi:hypothetical protein
MASIGLEMRALEIQLRKGLLQLRALLHRVILCPGRRSAMACCYKCSLGWPGQDTVRSALRRHEKLDEPELGVRRTGRPDSRPPLHSSPCHKGTRRLAGDRVCADETTS